MSRRLLAQCHNMLAAPPRKCAIWSTLCKASQNLRMQADLEEAEMERVHGEQYTEYKAHVSKLIPGIY